MASRDRGRYVESHSVSPWHNMVKRCIIRKRHALCQNGAAVAAMLSACLLLPLIDHSPAYLFNLTPTTATATPPPLHPTVISGEPEKWLSHVRLLRYHKGCDPATPSADLADLNGLLDTYNREVTAHRLSISRLACPYLLSSPSLPSLLLVCTT
ncbi:unnamed protein product [Pleuronectes platessa]|uniref:Uncharacterized protein n=1 Tax=Pleuronectes platessa TaxID=8262 RepID=A0A9N7VD19_PLEPL|nr:unnamed protein product [Pleuronectes platessa]